MKSLKEISIIPLPSSEGLTGKIPESLADLDLDRLILDSNSLTGTLPIWVRNIRNARMWGNKFTGPCPNPGWISDAVMVCQNQAEDVRLRHLEVTFVPAKVPIYRSADETATSISDKPVKFDDPNIAAPTRSLLVAAKDNIVPIAAIVLFVVGSVYAYRSYCHSGYETIQSSA
jgi:hypothetical protein